MSATQEKAAPPQELDLLTAMRAIEHAMHDDTGNYFKLRAYLDSHGRYHGNLQEEAVILEVAQVAIIVAERDHTPTLEAVNKELLEALEGIVNFYKPASHDERLKRQGPDENCTICKADAAIAKARGRQL